jgi:hypothetical protein
VVALALGKTLSGCAFGGDSLLQVLADRRLEKGEIHTLLLTSVADDQLPLRVGHLGCGVRGAVFSLGGGPVRTREVRVCALGALDSSLRARRGGASWVDGALLLGELRRRRRLNLAVRLVVVDLVRATLR